MSFQQQPASTKFYRNRNVSRKMYNNCKSNENIVPTFVISNKRPPQKPNLSVARVFNEIHIQKVDSVQIGDDEEDIYEDFYDDHGDNTQFINGNATEIDEGFSTLSLQEDYDKSSCSSSKKYNKKRKKFVKKAKTKRNFIDYKRSLSSSSNENSNNEEILYLSTDNQDKEPNNQENYNQMFHDNNKTEKFNDVLSNETDECNEEDSLYQESEELEDSLYQDSENQEEETYDNSDSVSTVGTILTSESDISIIRKSKKNKEKKTFTEYIPFEVAKRILAVQDFDKPNAVEGYLRINPRFHQHSYVSMPNGEEDVLIVGLKNRNRALDGDLVVVNINPECKWHRLTRDIVQRTGYVICILEKNNHRKAVGILKKQNNLVFLQPRDARIPLIKIKLKTVPNEFYDSRYDFKEILVSAIITDWKKIAFAEGEIDKIIGARGDLSSESYAILLENNLETVPIDDHLLLSLPPPEYIPTAYDLIGREDLRRNCVFTIDHGDAVYLDRAFSCKRLNNGNYEVGIHVADVTHFLPTFSPLDIKVAERATTVYMVDNVYYMLPKQLCHTCSLFAGYDKLAFSVIIELTPSAELVQYRFNKSLINSCCQMSYEQAQIMIDNPVFDWECDGTLRIIGKYRPLYLCSVLKMLNNLASKLRKARSDFGVLKINQPKLKMFLDQETYLPNSFKLLEKKEINNIVEEFIVLANILVAKRIYETYPYTTLLRTQAEPSKRILSHTRDVLKNFGININMDSAGSLNSSLKTCQPDLENQSQNSILAARYRMMVVHNLCSKSMMRPLYRCSSTIKSYSDLRHFALNVDLYTHFTSPLKRYADCLVHRLLFYSITNQPLPPFWDSNLITKLASNCNIKRQAAKIAQEQSNALYFTYMLSLIGSMETFAIVMEVKERSVDALLCDIGLKIRLYFSDTIDENIVQYTTENNLPTVYLCWTKYNAIQKISIFTILYVKIAKHPTLFKLQGIILPLVNSAEN